MRLRPRLCARSSTFFPILHVEANAPLSPSDRLLLETFAVKTGEDVWRLDCDRVLDAVADGHDMREIVSFLKSCGGGSLPDDVERFFTDMNRRLTAVTDGGRARLIRCADPALAAMIADDPATCRLCSLLGQDTLVISAKHEAAFLRSLRTLGFILLPQAGDSTPVRKVAKTRDEFSQ